MFTRRVNESLRIDGVLVTVVSVDQSAQRCALKIGGEYRVIERIGRDGQVQGITDRLNTAIAVERMVKSV